MLGRDNAVIQSTALQNRLTLEDEFPHPSWFVASYEDSNGKPTGMFIVQASRSIDAIEKIEQDVGYHLWLTNGGERIVGIPKLALTAPIVTIQKIRKENCLL